jgi:hypothetical protein
MLYCDETVPDSIEIRPREEDHGRVCVIQGI